MSDPCDFDIAVRIIGSDGTTVRADLNDHAAGLEVAQPIALPDENVRDAVRVSAARVDGDFRVAWAMDAATLPIRVTVTGSSWAQVESRWQVVRTAYKAEDDFYLELEMQGVTYRWRTERPNVQPEEIGTAELGGNFTTYLTAWRVQPNPSVTIL